MPLTLVRGGRPEEPLSRCAFCHRMVPTKEIDECSLCEKPGLCFGCQVWPQGHECDGGLTYDKR